MNDRTENKPLTLRLGRVSFFHFPNFMIVNFVNPLKNVTHKEFVSTGITTHAFSDER